MALHGKQYSGDLYGRRYGSNDSFQKLGNVVELKTSRKTKTDTLKSTGLNDYGEAIDSVTTSEPTELKLSFDTFDKEGLARALMGEAVDLGTSLVSFADEAHTVKLGWIGLAHDDLDPAQLVLKDDQGQTIDAKTYEVNPRLGMIRFNEHSTLLAGATFTVTGKTRGTAGYVIDANTLQTLPLELKLDGRDLISKKYGTLVMPHVELASDGDLDWFSDKWWKSGLSGTLIKDDGQPTMRFKEFG